jgi:ABC-type lipoprotein export system ATPase subunit
MPHQGRERQPRERGAVVLQLFAASSAARPSVPPLSITLHARELTLVQGETGSGKSTLLGLVAGVLSLDAGERVASSERIVSAERIRFAPQDPGLLLGARSVNQLLREGERERAGEVARLLNVAELLDRPAPRCSDGERRRLALVLTAAADPGLLILDEPTLGLDVDAAVRVADLLDEVAARGAAILVATHDPRLLTRGARLLQCPAELGGVAELSETSLIVRGASLAQEMLSPSPVKRFVGVTNPLTRVGLALFWFLLSALSPATAAAQGAVALPALLVAWSSGVRFAATLRLAATLAPAIIGMVLANLLGGATPEAAIGAGIRLVAFAAGSLVLLRPFEPLRLADAALQHLRAPFAPTLTLLASAATLPSLMSEARERRAIRRLTRAGVDPLLLADLARHRLRHLPDPAPVALPRRRHRHAGGHAARKQHSVRLPRLGLAAAQAVLSSMRWRASLLTWRAQNNDPRPLKRFIS